MNKSGQRIRKFNPGTFLSDEEVIEQFVVRKRELDIVLEVLHGNIDSPSCQHVLVVAPRGRGKTMLLARVAAELNTDEDLSECLLPVRFMEESHEVLNIADFWLETLFHLARESAKYDSDLARELRETHADLIDRWREKELADRVLAAVLDGADRLGKKLVLMVENLQSIGENVDDDFGWQLRRALQSEPQIMLFATATSRFKGLDDAEQPFFEQFRILDLEPLDTEDCCRLWQVVTGDEVSEDGIRPLEILTGGSPRLLVIVAQFAQHRSLRQLMEELVTLIDDHTEYFRSHLEILASVERRVYLAVIDLWQPSSAGEIAERARKDVRTVSTLLRRLVNRGAVIVEGTGRKRLYTAAERLYSIYYKLRRERDEAAVVANLIHFMAVFYSKAELAEMSDRLIAEAAESKVIQEGFERAIAEQPHVENSSSRLAWSAIKDILDQSLTKPEDIELEADFVAGTSFIEADLIDTDPDAFLLVLSVEEEINAAINEKEFGKVIEIVDRFVDPGGVALSQIPESFISYILYRKAFAYEKMEDFQAVIKVYNEVVERFGDTRDQTLLAWMAPVMVYGAIAQIKLGDFQAAIATCDEVVERFDTFDGLLFQGWVAAALTGKGSAQGKLGDYTAAIACYDEVIARFGTSDAPHLQVSVAWTLFDKGKAQRQWNDYTAAISAYDEVITRFRNSDLPDLQVSVAWALFDKGEIQIQLDKLTSAVATYDEAITRFGDSDAPALQILVASALFKKGDIQIKLDKPTSAVVCYDEMVTRFGDNDLPDLQIRVAWAFSQKGNMQLQLGEFVAAIACYDEVITRFGDNDLPDLQIPVAWALFDKGDVQVQLDKLAAAIACYDEVIARFGASDVPALQERVAWALCKKGDVQRRLNDYVAGVACYDEVIARFGDSEALALQERVAWALFDKGNVQGQFGEFMAAISAYDEVITRFGDSDVPALQVLVAWALSQKGIGQINMDQVEEALHTCEEIERRLSALTGNEKIEFTWRAKCVRVMALMVQKKRRAAVAAFRSAYAVFVPDNETVMNEMLHFVPQLIANGASERELLEILSSDKEKSDALVPLIVALRLRAGEEVRAPVEVLEVAKDINKDIDAKMSN